MPTLETYNGYHLWNYIPSRPAAITFIVVFTILTVGHIWRMLRHKMWFCIPFVVGGAFEVIGYVLRALAYDKTGELIPYVLQSSFLLLGPVLFAASLYMTLGRVIRAVDGEALSLVPLRWLTRIFVAGDVISFIVQASGAAIKSQVKDNNPAVGTNIVVGGLVFQVIIFGIFMVVAAVFNRRFRKSNGSSRTQDVPWQAALNMLYATSAMIMARNIFRVVEYAMGNDGYLLSVEWSVNVFDAGLMSLTMACFFWWYPSQLIPAMGVKSEETTSADIELLRK
ncbi:uncharacterized protein NECHADRAFT_42828 [Fusarium vanettenii 77-13-4]|uniref:RTA1 like protein n=1 Tax=Fusarium vanettenii (strain ATCC MYA-4622 / CBS 123669 / FGSC 9596 / NRRL 45880 / 77-13-4) TaxID=660122 RepID=C7ZA91_FUSV7|nr:uncharacterized protein NECHADRAFT_42828 [Fusarium vanettenii 77-13-4]EEU39233.1 hypothetical protein NECHADRAFT_42828 [Fusarium vanettenii 77-13-4]